MFCEKTKEITRYRGEVANKIAKLYSYKKPWLARRLLEKNNDRLDAELKQIRENK